MTDASHQLRIQRRDERRLVSQYRGRFEIRIIATLVGQSVAWIVVLLGGINGSIPLWLGLVLNSVLASMFYMPLHEAVHGNVWGNQSRARWGEDLVGYWAAIPLGFSYKGHRISHMQHHAYTNDPNRDPDIYTAGAMGSLPRKWYAVTLSQLLLPFLAFVPPTRRLLPRSLRAEFAKPREENQREGLHSLLNWLFMHGVLVAAFVLGYGWEALLLWYVPARIQLGWLMLVFAWFPHHPVTTTGRYVDTRVAVFRGSGLLIRGHDHHALHHLFPRVAHYNLPKLWQEIGPEMIGKGVRAEGRATGATGPVIW